MGGCKYLLLGTTNPIARYRERGCASASINLPPTGLRDGCERVFRSALAGKLRGLDSPRETRTATMGFAPSLSG